MNHFKKNVLKLFIVFVFGVQFSLSATCHCPVPTAAEKLNGSGGAEGVAKKCHCPYPIAEEILNGSGGAEGARRMNIDIPSNTSKQFQDNQSWSLSNDQKSLSIIKSNDITFLKSLYLPSVEILYLKIFPLGDISWINTSFPSVKKIIVEWYGHPSNKGYGLAILNLLNQFPHMESISIAVNKMTSHIFSDETKAAVLTHDNLKDFRLTFVVHRGFFDVGLFNHLESEIENMKLLTPTVIDFQYNVWESTVSGTESWDPKSS